MPSKSCISRSSNSAVFLCVVATLDTLSGGLVGDTDLGTTVAGLLDVLCLCDSELRAGSKCSPESNFLRFLCELDDILLSCNV